MRNLDAYLYVLLRNLHRAQLQKGLRQATLPLSTLEYDSADGSLRSLQAGERDDTVRLEMQNDLRRICQFACWRKETSRGGSILILRFFHGYYPYEIASILRCARSVVDERLHLVRREARAWLDEPRKLAVIDGGPAGAKLLPRSRLASCRPDRGPTRRVADRDIGGTHRNLPQPCATTGDLPEGKHCQTQPGHPFPPGEL